MAMILRWSCFRALQLHRSPALVASHDCRHECLAVTRITRMLVPRCSRGGFERCCSEDSTCVTHTSSDAAQHRGLHWACRRWALLPGTTTRRKTSQDLALESAAFGLACATLPLSAP